ncbi:hypothetical protein [Streptomyces sp. 8N706]|uniref:hypothetical protein n=1 Tax=Streptomyces sp. 8N706 TaxID=3457416 RepID=UPI003FD0FC79
MRKFDRGTLRTATFVTAMTVVFLIVNTSAAAAADGSGGEVGGLLAPLNVDSAEGAPLDGYELGADGGSIVNFASQSRALLLGGLFTTVRLLVGLACWLIEFAFRFPLLSILLGPAQHAAEEYNAHVVGALGLKGLMLSWGFIFGLILFVRGRVGKGLGEIVLTLTIAAIAASAFVRPDYLLAQGGPLDQTQQAAVEVAQITVNSHQFNATGADESEAGKKEACDLVVGAAKDYCTGKTAQSKEVARPLQDALTGALVVKPYMLLEYGRILDPSAKSDQQAYKTHLKWVKGGYKPSAKKKDEDPCELVIGPAGDYCNGDRDAIDEGLGGRFLGPEEEKFDRFTKDLEKAGKVGKASAAYAKSPTWDRVGAAALLLIAVVLVAAMVSSMALVLLGSQGADAIAAAGSGVALVLGMLPGPNRMIVWKWLAIFMVSVMVTFTAAMFLPFFGIAVDAILVDGPDLMVERLLLIDALAVMGVAFHRRLMAGAARFGERFAMIMRYAKVGGTHLPGDSSELGAALAMSRVGTGSGGLSSGLIGFGGLAGGSRAHAALGHWHRFLGNAAAMSDGTGMPMNPQQMLGAAGAEARRGLAPAALLLRGGGLGLRGAYGAVIGARPSDEQLAKWRKPTIADARARQLRATGEVDPSAYTGLGGNTGEDNGRIVNHRTGELIHDPATGRDLLGTRVHNRLVRFRGYRIASRAGRLGYHSTYALASTVARGGQGASRLTRDAREQLGVYTNTVREDGAQWASSGRAVARGGRRINQGVTTAAQRAHVAARVHGQPTADAARRGARDSAAGAVLYASPSRPGARSAGGGSPRPPVSADTRVEERSEARRRILAALMRAQRSTWDSQPRWGGDQE